MQRRFSAIALAGLILSACGSSSRKTLDTSTSPSSASTTLPGSTTTPTPTTGQPVSECLHRPISHFAGHYYYAPAIHGPNIDFRGDAPSNADDETVRQVLTPAGLRSVEKTGPDGTVTLTSTGLAGVGDFEGDGRVDLLVRPDAHMNYLVLGTLGPGTYAPAAVGVRVPQPPLQQISYEPENVGDQNGDGADDLGFGTELFSGRALASLAEGEELPAPFQTLPAVKVGILQLSGNGPPSIVVPDQTPPSLRVFDTRSDRLMPGAANASSLATLIGYERGSVTGWLVNGQHIVQYQYQDRSGGTSQWRWNLDAACET